MHRYVMTMDNDKGRERLKYFLNEMKKIWRDDVEIFFWIDWSTYDKPIREGCFPHNVWCNLSHIAILKDAIEKWYDEITVMEDDLICCNCFKQNFDHFILEAPEDWDMLRISWFFRPTMVMEPTKESIYRSKDIGPWWTECYILRWDAIKKVYDHLNVIGPDVPTDWEIYKAPIKSYMTTYSLWIQWDNYPI